MADGAVGKERQQKQGSAEHAAQGREAAVQPATLVQPTPREETGEAVTGGGQQAGQRAHQQLCVKRHRPGAGQYAYAQQAQAHPSDFRRRKTLAEKQPANQHAQSAETSEQRREALEFLVSGVDRATRIASQLLTMARIEPQLNTPVRSRVQLTELVREELAELTPLAMEKGVELVLEGDEECWVETEPVALAIALQNLVTNALNFSSSGREVTVVVHKDEEGRVCLRVEDAGPGIEEGELPRLFERFYSRGNANGAGLGLAIVQMVTRKIGASLHIHNLASGGVCAELSLNQTNSTL